MSISYWSSDVCSSDRAMGQEIEPSITGERRAGDIRHCLADIDLARSVLDYAPRENFDKGLAELADWVARQSCEDRVVTAWDELAVRGLGSEEHTSELQSIMRNS